MDLLADIIYFSAFRYQFHARPSLGLIMSGDPPTGNVPFLGSAKYPESGEGNFRRQLSGGREMERAAFLNQHSVKGFFKRNLSVLLTISAVALGEGHCSMLLNRKLVKFIRLGVCVCTCCAGVILGFAVRPRKLSPREIKYLTFPGELLMRMLQMLVLPLIVSSLVTGRLLTDRKQETPKHLKPADRWAALSLRCLQLGQQSLGEGGDARGRLLHADHPDRRVHRCLPRDHHQARKRQQGHSRRP